jgi:hypothetical protein
MNAFHRTNAARLFCVTTLPLFAFSCASFSAQEPPLEGCRAASKAEYESAASRRKGGRNEREIVNLHKELGVHSERYPLSGSSRFRGFRPKSLRWPRTLTFATFYRDNRQIPFSSRAQQ